MKKILIVLFFTLVLVTNGMTQERELKKYTTYQTSLTNEDIINSFLNEVRSYLIRYDNYGDYYYLVDYEVYQDRNKQNYSWTVTTRERKYLWGTMYSIELVISNALLWVHFSNNDFSSGGLNARPIIGTKQVDTEQGYAMRTHIFETAASMFNESERMLKMYNDSYSNKSQEAFSQIIRIALPNFF
jgi:hypothetical protein